MPAQSPTLSPTLSAMVAALRIVFGNVRLDLAHQVGADVGRLGVDAAADPHEQGQQGAAEAEAEEDLVGLLAVDDEDQGAAEQAEAVGEHAGDRAGPVAKLQGPAVARAAAAATRRLPAHRQGHAHETDRQENTAPIANAAARPSFTSPIDWAEKYTRKVRMSSSTRIARACRPR